MSEQNDVYRILEEAKAKEGFDEILARRIAWMNGGSVEESKLAVLIAVVREKLNPRMLPPLTNEGKS